MLVFWGVFAIYSRRNPRCVYAILRQFMPSYGALLLSKCCQKKSGTLIAYRSVLCEPFQLEQILDRCAEGFCNRVHRGCRCRFDRALFLLVCSDGGRGYAREICERVLRQSSFLSDLCKLAHLRSSFNSTATAIRSATEFAAIATRTHGLRPAMIRTAVIPHRDRVKMSDVFMLLYDLQSFKWKKGEWYGMKILQTLDNGIIL